MYHHIFYLPSPIKQGMIFQIILQFHRILQEISKVFESKQNNFPKEHLT